MTLLNRLSNKTLAHIDKEVVSTPSYDRAALPVRIVHIGPGAFHRAHQADVFDRLNEFDPHWGICGVSLRSAGVHDALAPQDGLYTLALLDKKVKFRVVGALKEVLTGDDPLVLERMSAPDTRIITMTVTEKGYCLNTHGELDFSHADIAHDVARPETPISLIGWLVQALAERMKTGAGGLNIISCDNQPNNGEKLKTAVLLLAGKRDGDLANWISKTCHFPTTMVDSITPATDDALREVVSDALSLEDAWPIQREAFTFWAISNDVSDDFPDLAKVGVVMTDDVAAFETMKLRLLNGAHSTLAYLGLAYGHETVARAMQDHDLRRFIHEMMDMEIAPSLQAPKGMELDEYIEALIDRFLNPALAHQLSQIAWDGSQKLPIRLLATIQDNLDAGRGIQRLAIGIAAWMRFVRRTGLAGEKLIDPIAETLLALSEKMTDNAVQDVDLMLRQTGVFPQSLIENPTFQDAVGEGYRFVLRREISIGAGTHAI